MTEKTVATKAMIHADSISKSFGSNLVLSDVCLSVDRGEVVCILGPSGSGKSTLLRCLNFLEVPDLGAVYLDGDRVGVREVKGELWALTDRQLAAQRAQLGMVFQRFNLFGHLTALQNVTMALQMVKKLPGKKAEQRGTELLERVGLGSHIGHRPSQLSGGQQQRVAIARAIALDPQAILFDEPTSALDPELVSEVLDVMGDLARSGMTMIVVTHEIGFARQVADRVVFMDGGIILEHGPAAEVLGAPKNPRLQTFLSKVMH